MTAENTLSPVRLKMAAGPGQPEPSPELAKLYHQGQNYEQAVGFAKQAVATDKGNIWYRFLLADLYNRVGYGADVFVIRKSIRSSPSRSGQMASANGRIPRG